MKAPDEKSADNGMTVSENMEKTEGNYADFPINEDLLLDEVAKKKKAGFEHILLEADESLQHPEARTGQKINEETQLDEVTKTRPAEYPDIE